MRRFSTLLFAFAMLVLLPRTVHAQDWDEDDGFDIGGLTIEVNAGAADYGRFLEQARVTIEDPDLIPGGPLVFTSREERELTAETAFTFGGSIGTWFQDDLGVRLGVNYNPTQFVFEDDTGDGSEEFDSDEVADLSAFTLSLEVLKFLVDPEENRFAPYANAGVAAGWWDLGEDEDGAAVSPIVAQEETQMRWGGVGGIGLQIGLTESFSTRIEISTFGLGNPFDGDEAFQVDDDEFATFDEPNSVRLTRLTLGLAYTFGGED